MKRKVILYTTSWCGDCWALKRFLDAHRVEYLEKDIEKDPEAYQTMMAYTKGKRVIPTVDWNGTILINPPLGQVESKLAS